MVLGVNVQDLRISYFGQTTGSTSRQWHSTWRDPIRIPELVKVEWGIYQGYFTFVISTNGF